MYKLSLFIGTFFLTLLNSRLIFQNRQENYGTPNMLESNILKMEKDLSAASHIAEILTANRNNKLKVLFFCLLLHPGQMNSNALQMSRYFNFQTFDLLGGGLRDGLAVRNNPGGGTLSITNHLDILRERLLRQIAKNRSKKPVRGKKIQDHRW